jgi:hypothetical protein
MFSGELFASREELEAKRIEDCKEFLISKGYRVEDPPKSLNFNIKTLDELIEFFYSRMSLKHPELKHVSRRKVVDRKIMHDFVKSRMIKGINKERAIDECAGMIEILFKFEDRFRFKYPVLSIGILGQGKLAWVTEKIDDFILQERIKERYRKRQEFNKRIDKKQEIEILEDSFTTKDELDQLLKEMEERNGKESQS